MIKLTALAYVMVILSSPGHHSKDTTVIGPYNTKEVCESQIPMIVEWMADKYVLGSPTMYAACFWVDD